MTLEDGFTVPWEKGDFLVGDGWMFILCDIIIDDNRQPNKHLLKYHALLSTREINLAVDNAWALGGFGRSLPYIAIGPSIGIGHYENYHSIRRATNTEIDNFLEIIRTLKNAVWNPELMRMDGLNGTEYATWRSHHMGVS